MSLGIVPKYEYKVASRERHPIGLLYFAEFCTLRNPKRNLYKAELFQEKMYFAEKNRLYFAEYPRHDLYFAEIVFLYFAEIKRAFLYFAKVVICGIFLKESVFCEKKISLILYFA